MSFFSKLRSFLTNLLHGKKKLIPVTMNPDYWQMKYCVGMPYHPYAYEGGWAFDMPSVPNSVHYLVYESNKPLAGSIRLRVKVQQEEGTTWDFKTNENNTGSTPCSVRLYFQRKGDDLSAIGDMQYYRWWTTVAINLERGETEWEDEIVVSLDPSNWTSVYGANGATVPDKFKAACDNLVYVGMTFGGGSFYGHGVRINSGAAKFICTQFNVG